MPALDFSFSGIKTAFLYFLREHTANDPAFITHRLPDICASLQHTLVTMLLSRVEQAAALTGITSVGISGGVSANSCLRHQFQIMGQKQNWKTFVPDFAYCTDNAAMIAMAAHFQYLRGDFCALDVTPLARMPIPS
jgi:N6-L-threonylcarbamoyladenine synthase